MKMRNKELKLLGQYLSDLRRSAGVSQLDAAEYMGFTSSQYISNIERGICIPSLEYLIASCELYNVKPKELIKVVQDLFGRSLKGIFKGDL